MQITVELLTQTDTMVNQSHDFKDFHKTIKFIPEHTITTEELYTKILEIRFDYHDKILCIQNS